ncbi:CoA-binding protein [bacterium]
MLFFSKYFMYSFAGGILVLILVILLLREFFCWYFKINEKNRRQENILEEIKKLSISFEDLTKNNASLSNNNILVEPKVETKEIPLTEDELITKLFTEYKSIAVYGMEKTDEKVFTYLRAKQYRIIPINPSYEKIDDLKAFPTLISVDQKVDVVFVPRAKDKVAEILKEATVRKKMKGDVSFVWFGEGIYDEDAANLARKGEIDLIQNKCVYKEYLRLMLKAKTI